jgi:alpha-tubulin suppressor-like RCC1 family protein
MAWLAVTIASEGIPTTSTSGGNAPLIAGQTTSCTGVVDVTVGNPYTCAIFKDGTARCWGDNNDGQLGDGTTSDKLGPTVVSGLSNVRSISASFHSSFEDRTCVVLEDGTARCWGDNSYDQLGDGTTTDKLIPTVVSGLNNVRSISAGGLHTCALLEDGTARCWGLNVRYQLGDGTTDTKLVPTVVPSLSNVRSILAGYWHTCALLEDGTVCCWGYNFYGQLGDGGSPTHSSVRTVVPSLSNVRSISVGYDHTCAVMEDGTARCWGDNSFGQFGVGTTYTRGYQTVVSGLSNVRSISAGYGHTCAVLEDGTARCWGFNNYGQ